MRRQQSARLRAIEARLTREFTVWLATTRHDKRAHLVPVWFIWLDGIMYIVTGSDTQKFLNISFNASVSLSLPDTESVVIVEGEASEADRSTINKLGDYFYHKYEWDFRYDESTDWRLIEIMPTKILAWGDGYDQQYGIRVL